ncbi:MAG TPA: serine/threonine-protein kinase [Kiritimatiellia bacterium]|nr:serine/threonine-protein kinase [Candidatus Latescibacterota bacterium]HOM59124.1 serine/threonine-protein kinase [Kiritimatiellia bacterium]HOR97935.1 serine/threonine-protein kinase [Kiritimatiellia bacterium]HPK37727.1 serine/threonine-protein kinase [Kiritimatiellia bacterium]HRU20545.1 serine/threonine-protein kinase [Kiritimatiellia bacterium]
MRSPTSFSLPNVEVLEVIGHGGMASVWKARQVSLDRLVAVKILSPDFSSDPEDIRRFRQEAQAAARLKHPGIVQVYDANFSDGVYYFIMELVEGYTLGNLVRRKGRVPMEDALIVAENVAVVLNYAWETAQIIHCDIKPDNIMADADGTVKVTDLGLCRSLTLRKGSTTDKADEILGTPAYMSPEQVYGSDRLDCRSDIYALGVTLYHLVTGRVLFDGQSEDETLRSHTGDAQAPDVRTLAPETSEAFALLLEKMLAKHPDHRHRDWKSVLTDLSRLRSGHLPCPALIPSKGSSMLRLTQ